MNTEYLKQKIKKSFLGKVAISLRYMYPNTKPKYSYSQTGEDLILDFFLKGKKTGFYLDVGAYHPVNLSNTYRFYKRGWSGINIEPNHNKFDLFRKQRTRDINLNVGIGPSETSATFFIFDADTLSTFSKEAMENYKKIGHNVTETNEIELMPLKNIIEKYAQNKKIDFLSVDTEGYDLEVLKTNDWNLYRPSFIILETVEYSKRILGKKLNATYDLFMNNIGYNKIADTYINTIYIDKNIINSDY
jgi:FkbM family methyltransferase